MRSLSTAAVLVAAIFIGDVVAGPHMRHQQFHKKRDEVVVTEDYLTTVTITDVVTVEWPPASSTPASSSVVAAPTTTSAAVHKEAAAFIEKSSSSTTPKPTTSATPIVAAAVAPASSSTSKAAALLDLAVNVGSVSAEVAVAKPTTLATQVKPTTQAAATTPKTTTAAPAATTSSSSSSGSSGNTLRGVPFNDHSLLSAFVGSGSKIDWCYDWSSSGSGTTGIEYIPMLWSDTSTFTSSWTANANAAIASGSSALLAFNEPDLAAQSNLSPADAAAGWIQWIEPFKGKARLGSPAVTNGASPMGTAWITSWLEACDGKCSVDFCNYHFYDSATNIDYFKSYVPQAYAACNNKPIWFTEIGLTGSDDQISAWIDEIIPWLESLGYVERVAYFMASDGVLNTGSGLSALGQAWADFSG